MRIPDSVEARFYFRAAEERFRDAEFLLVNSRTTGAVYLAGYSVECIIKSLILSVAPKRDRRKVLESFRGAKAHNFEWLKFEYRQYSRGGFPAALAPDLVRVATWSTDLRYNTGTWKTKEAEAFLQSAAAIINWAKERI